jgi:hypothetical protein
LSLTTLGSSDAPRALAVPMDRHSRCTPVTANRRNLGDTRVACGLPRDGAMKTLHHIPTVLFSLAFASMFAMTGCASDTDGNEEPNGPETTEQGVEKGRPPPQKGVDRGPGQGSPPCDAQCQQIEAQMFAIRQWCAAHPGRC